jgi:WS/DGAT/MGAT family acyltransferase
MDVSSARSAHEPLLPEDWMFLACESPDAPMHVGATLLFEPGQSPIGLDRLRRYMEAHLDDVPRYRQRLAYTPIDRRPVWVDDGNFDLGAHVGQVTLATPGDEACFRSAVNRILSRPLDRRGPLWECWLIDGRADGRFALVTKIHHGMVDGGAGADLLALLLSPTPQAREPVPRPWTPRPVPTALTLLAETLLRPARLARDVWRETARVARNPRRLGDYAPVVQALWQSMETAAQRAPTSPLNRPLGPHRVVAYAQTDFGRARTIKTALGGTVNDVVLATVAGVLRRFLLARDPEMEIADLRVLVPVDRRGGDHRPLGNHISGWIVPLPVSVRAPLERHARVRQATEHLKRTEFARAGELLMATTGTLLGAALKLVEHLRPFNVTVSNIPGPTMPLYLLDARLDAIYPHVPLFPGQGLSIAVLSYAGHLHWGLTGECQIVPDLERLAEAVEWSLAELETAVGTARTRQPPASVRWSDPVVHGSTNADTPSPAGVAALGH